MSSLQKQVVPSMALLQCHRLVHALRSQNMQQENFTAGKYTAGRGECLYQHCKQWLDTIYSICVWYYRFMLEKGGGEGKQAFQ